MRLRTSASSSVLRARLAASSRSSLPSPAGMRASCQVPGWTPLVIAMMGAAVLHVRPHGARGLPVQLRHRVGQVGQAQAGHRHVERVAADLGQLARHQLAAGPEAPQVRERVHLVARGDRGVGGEDDALARGQPRVPEGLPGFHAVGDHLDAREDGVALVEVVALDRQVERAQRPHPADPEQHLLRHATVRPRVVESPGDPQVARIGGLEQVERRDRVAAHAPDAALDLARRDAHAHPRAGVGEDVGLLIGPLVVGIAVGADVLGGVALAPAEPDADDGQAEVARRLHEVAREHAEAARVGVEVLVQAVLHREVGDQRRAGRGVQRGGHVFEHTTGRAGGGLRGGASRGG